jgi:hypothetical protein
MTFTCGDKNLFMATQELKFRVNNFTVTERALNKYLEQRGQLELVAINDAA